MKLQAMPSWSLDLHGACQARNTQACCTREHPRKGQSGCNGKYSIELKNAKIKAWDHHVVLKYDMSYQTSRRVNLCPCGVNHWLIPISESWSFLYWNQLLNKDTCNPNTTYGFTSFPFILLLFLLCSCCL